MIPNNLRLPGNLALRPAREGDRGFLEQLYRSTRNDLRSLEAEPEMVESLIDMQYRARHSGYGQQFPDAWSFIVEYATEPIGQLMLDFTSGRIHLVDIAFVPTARDKGFGTQVLRALQIVAAQVWAPITLTVHPLKVGVRRLYASLGFLPLETHPVAERLIWYPEGYPKVNVAH